MASSDKKIILYHYSFSPYARRIVWYLALRGLPYVEVRQPPVMPRPDLQAIGVNYRRIPVMAIGKDIYCDTRLILDKLEHLYPQGALGATTPEHKAIEQLLQIWTVEAGVFTRGAQLIPTNSPVFKDARFIKDREDFSGRSWEKAAMDANRPEALAHIRIGFTMLENTLLADGRNWILNTEHPTLADIQGIWVFDWLIGLPGALPEDIISERSYPKIFAWIKRFNAAIKAAKAEAPKPLVVQGKEAAESVLNSNFAETEMLSDSLDPLSLRKGMEVEIHPTDGGGSGKDRGSLVALTQHEVVIELKNSARLHFPRTSFRVKKIDGSGSKL